MQTNGGIEGGTRLKVVQGRSTGASTLGYGNTRPANWSPPTHTRTKRRRVTRSLEICCLSLLLLLLLNGAHSLPTNDDARKKEKEPRVRRFITICSFSSIKFIICTMFLRMKFGKGKFSMTRFRLSGGFNRYRTFIRRCYYFFFSLKNLLPDTSMILSYPTSFNIEPRHEL